MNIINIITLLKVHFLGIISSLSYRGVYFWYSFRTLPVIFCLLLEIFCVLSPYIGLTLIFLQFSLGLIFLVLDWSFSSILCTPHFRLVFPLPGFGLFPCGWYSWLVGIPLLSITMFEQVILLSGYMFEFFQFYI